MPAPAWSTSTPRASSPSTAPQAVEWLVEPGVPFSPDPTGPLGLHLTREGGHAVRRIAHAADATGAAIHDALLAKARAHPNITLRERWMAVDLITSRHLRPRRAAALLRRVRARHRPRSASRRCRAAAVVLATGGAGKVYLYTTNPDTATGDGIAMAWRAGCRVGEHGVHPVPPDLPVPPAGAQLPDHRGAARRGRACCKLPRRRRASCRAHDARAELAPRDIVARAIDFEMKKHGLDCV